MRKWDVFFYGRNDGRGFASARTFSEAYDRAEEAILAGYEFADICDAASGKCFCTVDAHLVPHEM